MKTLRKYHKWPSLIVGLFIILFCVSGIVMNHRSFFSTLNFPRKLLPSNYHYDNWNLASVKGFVPVGNDSLVLYGNIGVWKTDTAFSSFRPMNDGFPRGIGNRKILTLTNTKNGRLFAGALYDLFEFNKAIQKWEKIELPVGKTKVYKVFEKNDTLMILTRSELIEMPLAGRADFGVITLPPTKDQLGKAAMFRTIWLIHSGEILGMPGKILVDIMGLIVAFLTLSGLFYTFLPKFSRRIKESLSKRLKKTNRKTINWHTKIGVYTLPFLLLLSITGMFLRPPLLIPIAYKNVTAIPGTELASKNTWYKKLRDVVYDSATNSYIVSSNEGFVRLAKHNGRYVTTKLAKQPPVSVMGINAFELLPDGDYLIGSFSGIYKWNQKTGRSTDYITGLEVNPEKRGSPFGAVAVAGVYMRNGEPSAIIDYTVGWMDLKSGKKPSMPHAIANLPMSWWNLALEIHTGRIFEFLVGKFYILYVPLMGISIVVILITGFLMYLRARKRKKQIL